MSDKVDADHKIYDLAEGKPDIYHVTDDGGVLAEIDFDREAEIPIFAFAQEDNAHTVFLISEEGPSHIRVLMVRGEEDGDMREMLDFVTSRFGINHLTFFNIVNPSDLNQAIPDLSTKTINVRGDRVLVGEVIWE